MGKIMQNRSQWRGLLLTILVFTAMVFALVSALSQVDEKKDTEQTKILRDAVLRATLTCYAVEGRYPPNARYMVENYGIVYDDEKYIVRLESFAPNLLPDIYVLTQGGTVYEP